MRRIFTSQRVETAEGVAKHLRDAGIEVHVTNGHSYRSRRSGQFSYMDKRDPSKEPTVWVVHAEDQVRAREVLRLTGLLDTTRRDPGAAAAFSFADVEIKPRTANGRWAWRLRMALLVLIAAVALFIVLRPHPAAPAQPVVPQEPPVPTTAVPEAADEEIRVRIVPAS